MRGTDCCISYALICVLATSAFRHFQNPSSSIIHTFSGNLIRSRSLGQISFRNVSAMSVVLWMISEVDVSAAYIDLLSTRYLIELLLPKFSRRAGGQSCSPLVDGAIGDSIN